VALKSYLEWLTMSYVIGDSKGMAAAVARLALCLHAIICLWDLAGIDTMFR